MIKPAIEDRHTVGIQARVNHTRTDTNEQYAVLLKLCLILGRNHVHGRFADRVWSTLINSVLDREIMVRHSRSDGDDFLDVSLENKRHEEVDEVNVAENIGVPGFIEVVGEFLWVSA